MKFDGIEVAPWIVPRLRFARENGFWTGKVNSGIRSHAEQTALYSEWKAGHRAGPVAVPGTSNHEKRVFPGGAVDITDPAGMVSAMAKWKALGKPNPLVWFGSGDQVHFSASGH